MRILIIMRITHKYGNTNNKHKAHNTIQGEYEYEESGEHTEEEHENT